MLPTFVGIGAPRCGSTWLHELLRSHPQVRMPSNRKEIHYFDRFPDRSTDWYENWFGDVNDRAPVAVGEITPTYLYTPLAAERIAQLGTVTRLLLILRNPVDRLHSRYKHQLQRHGYRGTFEQFVAEHPLSVAHGHYSRFLPPFLDVFGRERLTVLVLEEAVQDLGATKMTLAHALGIAPTMFPDSAGSEVVRPEQSVRFRTAYGVANRISNAVRYRLGMDGLADAYIKWGRRLGVHRLFGKGQQTPMINPTTRRRLAQSYSTELHALGALLERDFSVWREH